MTIEMEHVDVARFASPEAEERRLRTVYGSKYGNQRFDVIVAALPEPFQFVLRARDELWPGTPVVVCGVDERSVSDLKPPPGFAVLTIRFDMEGTVRAALALLPDTRHVALVGGASPPEQVYHDLLRQIQQVILNLLTNAITAAANGGAPAGKVTVWTSDATAPYVELGVRDSGKGIAEADLARIFEPFFTTKLDGLGMGLAISRAIVEAHGGRLLVENDPAGGAVFRVRLRTDRPATN